MEEPGIVNKLTGSHKGLLKLELVPEDGLSRKSVRVRVHPFFFEGKEHQLAYSARSKSDEFDYGYALTVHKSQGSQWDDVVLFDQSGAFRENQKRWLYTAVTRAAKRITIVA